MSQVHAGVVSDKSTSVRNIERGPRSHAVPLWAHLARSVFAALGWIAPRAAAGLAERLFFTAPRSRRSARVEEFLASGSRFHVLVDGQRLAAWRWGRGPAVLLVHGWGGRGGQLAAFAPELVARGFSVVTFDGPGHGASQGRRSSMVEIARALRAVAAVSGPLHAIVAHSLGASAAALAMRDGLRVRRVVLVAAPANPVDWTRRFARLFGLSPEIVARMRALSEARLGRSWAELDVPTLAAGLAAPALVVHDRDDAEVAWSEGALIADAWPGASLLTTTGLGHRRILRDPAVVAAAVEFVAAPEARTAAGAPGCAECADAVDACDACAFGTELFDRGARWSRLYGSAA